METIHPDFKELLESLNEAGVDFVVAGSHALAFHGAPRYTGDIDLLVGDERRNAEKLLEALGRFGFGDLGLRPEDFMNPETVVQLGVAPARVDFLTSLTGVRNKEAFKDAVPGTLGGVPARFLSRELLIENKRALGRTKDLADIEALGEIETKD